MNISALHSYLRTKNEATKLILLLEKLIDELFKEIFSLDKILASELTLELKIIIEKLIKESGIKTENKKEVQAFLAKLQEELSRLPVVHIILSISPKEQQVEIIHNWFYQNFQKTVLLDISIDPTIIGGGVISFNGRANDYSLRNKIGQMQDI